MGSGGGGSGGGSGGGGGGAGPSTESAAHNVQQDKPPPPTRAKKIRVKHVWNRNEPGTSCDPDSKGTDSSPVDNSSSEAKITVTASPPQKNPPDMIEEKPKVFKEEPPAIDWSEKCIEWVSEITAAGVSSPQTPPRSAPVSRPSSGRSRDWASSGVTPLLGRTGVYPDVSFANELWYKKGYKHLKARRASDPTRAPNPSRAPFDHLLLCPTASSRARQVSAPPSTVHTADSVAGRRDVSQPDTAAYRRRSLSSNKFAIPPDRFKGTRTVTSEELKQIVERLSTCDPTRVPDSTRSKIAQPPGRAPVSVLGAYCQTVSTGAEGGDSQGQRESLKNVMGVSVSTMVCPDEQLTDQQKTIFHWCQEGNMDKVKAMLTSEGHQINEKDSQDSDGQTALHYAMHWDGLKSCIYYYAIRP
nr:hypothetical protein BaRGS_013021 [Batillaria attramentaria]